MKASAMYVTSTLFSSQRFSMFCF